MYDVAVVGGGPAGTITASLLAKDHETVVLEEHCSSGLPTQCAGLVTEDVVRMCGIRPDILNRMAGADVIFPGGERFEVRSKSIKALLIDRHDLDSKLADKAVDSGAEIRYGTKYQRHTSDKDGVRVLTDQEDMSANILIGADGHNSRVAMTICENGPKEYLYGMAADAKHKSEYSDIMTLRLGSEVAPGFFSWEMPFGDMTRIGLCIRGGTGNNPNYYLKKLMRTVGIEESDIISKYSGKIPIGGRLRSYGTRTLLIGDAAGQVKPISGGGLYPICKAAPILERIVKESLISERLSARDLSRYEKEWKREIGKELSRGYRIRKMYNKLTDSDLDKAFDIINRDDMHSILNSINIDAPSSVALPMLRNPHVGIRFLPLMIRGIL